MHKQQYQTFLLTRVIQRNDFGTIGSLVKAINDALAIPEFRARKGAFNAIGEKAPLRASSSSYCLVHADIPAFLEREWQEYSVFKQMTGSMQGKAFNDAVARYWIPDEAKAVIQHIDR